MNCAIINRAVEQRGRNQVRKGALKGWIDSGVSVSRSSGGVAPLAMPMVAKRKDASAVTSYAGFMSCPASHSSEASPDGRPHFGRCGCSEPVPAILRTIILRSAPASLPVPIYPRTVRTDPSKKVPFAGLP